MNINQMRCCLEIYYTGNFHTASDNLFITQPALTQQLKRVEEELGVRIFNRSTRSVSVTREGQAVVEAFQKIVHTYTQLEAHIADAGTLKNAKLTIGVPPIRALQFLPDFLPQFTQLYPTIDVTVQERHSASLKEDLKRGSVDIAFMVLEKSAEEMEFIPLAQENTFLITRDGSPSDLKFRSNTVQGHPLDIPILQNEPFAMLPKVSNIRKRADAMFLRYNIHPPIIFESQTSLLNIALASQGMANSIATGIALYFARDQYQPRQYSLSHEIPPYRIGISIHPDHFKSAAMKVFIRFCQEKMRQYPFCAVEPK